MPGRGVPSARVMTSCPLIAETLTATCAARPPACAVTAPGPDARRADPHRRARVHARRRERDHAGRDPRHRRRDLAARRVRDRGRVGRHVSERERGRPAVDADVADRGEHGDDEGAVERARLHRDGREARLRRPRAVMLAPAVEDRLTIAGSLVVHVAPARSAPVGDSAASEIVWLTSGAADEADDGEARGDDVERRRLQRAPLEAEQQRHGERSSKRPRCDLAKGCSHDLVRITVE